MHPKVTECSKCGQPLNGGSTCTFLPGLLALRDDLAKQTFHCGTCCPGHRAEPQLFARHDSFAWEALQRAADTEKKYDEGR